MQNNVNNGILKYPNYYGYSSGKVYEWCYNNGLVNKPIRPGRFNFISYANNVTNEGYGIWFIAKSNLNGVVNREWKDTIFNNGANIDEEYIGTGNNTLEPITEKKLIFAKDKNNQYMFLGLFECQLDPQKKVRHYHRIQDFYK